MSVALSLPAIEAAAFTMGCALIHAQRRHAERITRLLLALLCVAAMVLALGWGIERADAEPGPTDLSAAFTGISE
jgi:flagellar biogenesis protein FliO